MKRVFCFVWLISALMSPKFALAETPAETAEKAYNAATEQAKKEYDSKVKVAKDAYIAKLKKEMENLTRAAKLDEAIKIKDAIAAIEAVDPVLVKTVTPKKEIVANDELNKIGTINTTLAQYLIKNAKSLSKEEWEKVPGKIYSIRTRDVHAVNLELAPGRYVAIAALDDMYELEGIQKMYKLDQFLYIQIFDKIGTTLKNIRLSEFPTFVIDAKATQVVLRGGIAQDGGLLRVKVSKVE